MEAKVLEAYKQAGKIAKEAVDFSRKLVKEGASILEIADKTEEKIISLGGKLAFPVNISINEVAAHHVPAIDDKTILKLKDLVKIDIGVHIDGYIADTAYSVSIGKDEINEKLIKAAEDALNSALNIAKPEVEFREIGKVIGEKIASYGFQPIVNLSGHSLDQYNLHAGLTIPNFDNENDSVFEDNDAIAIEPFATTGQGTVIDGKSAEVFRLEKEGNVRVGKEVLEYIIEEFATLPFARRWLIRKFGAMKTNLVLREGAMKGFIHPYNELREKTNGKVAQAEHTLIVKANPIITTK